MIPLFLLFLAAATALAESPVMPIDNANWSGSDDLGRELPGHAEVGDPKPGHWVGLFYFQWHDHLRALPGQYNMTEFLQAHPGYTGFTANPPGGPNNPTWYWAEPLYGYYDSSDPWVIARQLLLIADAGVDFIFIDATNNSIHPPALDVLLRVSHQLQSAGAKVPKIVFFLNSGYEQKLEQLYRDYYKPGLHDDLWFNWQGKPLIMSAVPTDPAKFKDPALLEPVRNAFTYRPTWAFFKTQDAPTKWRFMDGNLPRVALGPDGKVEQSVVSKSLGGPIFNNMKTAGVSCAPGHVPVYNAQYLSAENGQGLFFQAQWDAAEQTQPPILLVTGWNEWTASVWEQPGVVMLGHATTKGQGHLVDEFNMDFNRDLEPMKGGYRDNYYMQFVANMRRYKGMPAPAPASAAVTIPMNGDFSAWNGVRPVYRHAVPVAGPRDFKGNPPGVHYADASARNEIASAQVACDARMVYFHVRAARPLSPATDPAWMTLLIHTGAGVGWNGYEFAVNRTRSAPGKAGVERNVDGQWQWEPVGEAALDWKGADLEIAVPRALLGFEGQPLRFDFKWTDNLPAAPDLMDFYSRGGVAPDGRFNYRYEEAAP